jgi:hypothetical protein
MEFEYAAIAQATGTQPDEVKSILDFIKSELTDEQISKININAQSFCNDMWQMYLDNPEDYGLI